MPPTSCGVCEYWPPLVDSQVAFVAGCVRVRQTTIAEPFVSRARMIERVGTSGSSQTVGRLRRACHRDARCHGVGPRGCEHDPAHILHGWCVHSRAAARRRHATGAGDPARPGHSVRPQAHRRPHGVNVRASFGLYSDSNVRHRLVWIVHFWGPGLALEGSGGGVPFPGTPYCAPPVAHDSLVFVDGISGKIIELESGLSTASPPTVAISRGRHRPRAPRVPCIPSTPRAGAAVP
jgi:hypothetical protein